MARLCVFLLAAIIGLVGAADLGISFNETLKGFFTDGERTMKICLISGDMDYQQAFDQGKTANRYISFTCHVEMDHMQDFVNDPQHGEDFLRGR